MRSDHRRGFTNRPNVRSLVCSAPRVLEGAVRRRLGRLNDFRGDGLRRELEDDAALVAPHLVRVGLEPDRQVAEGAFEGDHLNFLSALFGAFRAYLRAVL